MDMDANIYWMGGLATAALGLLIWALATWRGLRTIALVASLLSAAGVVVAVWQALNGVGSLGLLLLGACGAALILWLFGLAVASPEVKRSAFAWLWPLLLVLLLRNFGWEPYRIPSGSMLPTLEPGDYVLINRHAYGLNLSPLNYELYRIGEVKRGDVVVFAHPQEGTVLIKRILGLPGDEIEMRLGRLYINDRPVRRTRRESDDEAHRQFVEEASGHSWIIQQRADRRLSLNDIGVWKVPPDSYFALGDNRDNSRDSRVWGTFPRSHLLGRAERIWLYWPEGQWPSFDRWQEVR